jgi:hypothetical protein
MRKIDVGQAVAILANFGVITGIVFLAIEVRQNQTSLDQANELERAAAIAAALDYFNDFRAMLAQDEQLNEIWDSRNSGRELTAPEARRFAQLCDNWFWILATMYERFHLLGEEQRAIEGPVTNVRNNLGNPRLAACIDDGLVTARRWGYVSFADAVMNAD